MKPIHAMAVLAALAAGPALAQQYPPSGQMQQQGAQGRPDAVIMGVEIPAQAVQPETMAQIQQQLQQEGLYRGPVDGIYGDQTRQALAQWQRQQGLEPTGQLNSQTLAQMDLSGDTQQAMTPEERNQQQSRSPDRDTGEVETLRSEQMQSPNVEGENAPESPATGIPRPGADPERLETVPRP